MPPRTRPTLPSFLVAAALAAPLALAQQPEGTAPPTQPTGRLSPRPPRAATEPGKLLSVEFNGGTLAQFVDAVKAASPDPINVIVPAELARISVPAVSLKSLSPMMALQSLEFAVNRASAIGGARGIEQAGAVGQIRVVQLNTENGNNAASGSAPTFAVSYERAMTHPQHAINAASAAALSTRVFSVRELLAVKEQQDVPGLTLDQIVQPVETALSVDAGDAPGDEAPRVMVHRESNLIIVRGTQRQTELTRQVLDRLREDVEVARDRARPEADFRRAMEEITAQRAAEEASAERLMVSASKQLQAAEQRLQALRAEKNADATDIESAHRKLQEAERYHVSAAQTLDRIKARTGDEMAAARTLVNQRRGASTELRALREQLEDLRKQLEDFKAARAR